MLAKKNMFFLTLVVLFVLPVCMQPQLNTLASLMTTTSLMTKKIPRKRNETTGPLLFGRIAKKRKVNIKKPKHCFVNFEDKRINANHDPNVPTIYFVTPTYPRPEQMPELTRLSHTLMHVPRLHWILADDNLECSARVLSILTRSGLPFTYISSPKPDQKEKPFHSGVVSRGVSNRRAALHWIHDHVFEGILYFGDDDNTYDLQLFNEIRKTKKLSMFPVGLIGSFGVSSPVIDNNVKVVGFFDSWFNHRKFAVDMAGFAVNIKHLNRSATMPYEAGMLEDNFLTSAGFHVQDIEPLADNCTKVLVWHTQTLKHKTIMLRVDIDIVKNKQFKYLRILLEELFDMKVVELNPLRGINASIIQNHKKYNLWTVGINTKKKKK